MTKDQTKWYKRIGDDILEVINHGKSISIRIWDRDKGLVGVGLTEKTTTEFLLSIFNPEFCPFGERCFTDFENEFGEEEDSIGQAMRDAYD